MNTTITFQLDTNDSKAYGVLATVMGFFGSLQGHSFLWKRIVKQIKCGKWTDNCPAQTLVENAVPDVGEPHPQRAEVGWPSDGSLVFTTPGNVSVVLWVYENKLNVEIDFNRKSVFACLNVCSLLVSNGVRNSNILLNLTRSSTKLLAEQSIIEDREKQRKVDRSLNGQPKISPTFTE